MGSGSKGGGRRRYSDELKMEAVQMMLDGHSAQSVVDRLGLSGTNILYSWKAKYQASGGGDGTSPVADSQVEELRREIRRLELERDILKKALAILSQRT
jgi:transposase